jgi:hypothetical protein
MHTYMLRCRDLLFFDVVEAYALQEPELVVPRYGAYTGSVRRVFMPGLDTSRTLATGEVVDHSTGEHKLIRDVLLAWAIPEERHEDLLALQHARPFAVLVSRGCWKRLCWAPTHSAEAFLWPEQRAPPLRPPKFQADGKYEPHIVPLAGVGDGSTTVFHPRQFEGLVSDLRCWATPVLAATDEDDVIGVRAQLESTAAWAQQCFESMSSSTLTDSKNAWSYKARGLFETIRLLESVNDVSNLRKVVSTALSLCFPGALDWIQEHYSGI